MILRHLQKIILFLVLLAISPSTFACTCKDFGLRISSKENYLAHKFKRAQNVITGRVTKISCHSNNCPYEAKYDDRLSVIVVRIEKRLKNHKTPKYLTFISSINTGTGCGIAPEIGAKYLIYVNQNQEQRITLNTCNAIPLENAKDEIAMIKRNKW